MFWFTTPMKHCDQSQSLTSKEIKWQYQMLVKIRNLNAGEDTKKSF